VIEDEKDIVRLLRYNLEKDKHQVFSVNDAESALKLMPKARPDLIILDIMLPKMSGLDFLREIRAKGYKHTPVILLSAKRSETDRILGLKLGADDYMVKPFSIGELQARIEGHLRRAVHSPLREDDERPITVGAIEVDTERHEIRVRGKRANLAPKEFSILQYLIEANGKVLSRDQLLKFVWGHDKDIEIDTRTVDQHIARLRHKLRPEDGRIRTVPNFGYQINMK
jgi:two-component system alkaline phosphatase synthesis response regulator PhoP